MKLDILCIAAHPDDVELSCGGTVARHADMGYKVGIVDLTEGQLGTRGTPKQRLEEAANAAGVFGLEVRDNLHMMDFFFYNDKEHQTPIVRAVRQYQPDIVIANALEDRHPDHGKAAKLISDSCFLAGLRAFETELAGEKQEAWRPRRVYHMIQDHSLNPDVVVDISDYFDKKIEAIKAFKSQFHTGGESADGPQTPISTPDFIHFLEARARHFGRKIGVQYGEGFQTPRSVGTSDLVKLL